MSDAKLRFQLLLVIGVLLAELEIFRESAKNTIYRNTNKQEEFTMATKVLANNGQVGENVKFDRIRRITGYLVGTTDRFNNAKRAEERDRVKHSL